VFVPDIPLPEAVGRRQLFKLNLEKVDIAPDVDYEKLVGATEVPKINHLLEWSMPLIQHCLDARIQGYSGDDICGLCEAAKMMPVKRLYTPELLKELHRKKQDGASEEEIQAQEKSALVVTWQDFQTALENVSKSVGHDQLEKFSKWEEEFGSK
jgi:katanin p60 ATPase-containing subunit A1